MTGGGRGIGRGISLVFVREGARLALAACGKRPLTRRAGARFGTVDILVNNAGIDINKRVDLASVEEYDRIVDTNLKGTWMGCHYVAPVMMEAGGGSIVDISSIHGISGLAGMSTYAASKAGIISATRVIAQVLRPSTYG